MTMVDTRLLGKPERWNGNDSTWKDWRFIVRAYLQAAMPQIGVLLQAAEEGNVAVDNTSIPPTEQAASQQLYYVLVLLTHDRALDKVMAAGEGEGLLAWRQMHTQWEPKSRSRFTSMLVSILSSRFAGDAQASLEAFQKNIREFEAQSGHAIPDFIKAGIVMNGVEERSLRYHLIMHAARLDDFEKIKQEVTEIARTRAALGGPTPVELDALKGFGKGKGKGGKGKDDQSKDAKDK